MRTLRLCPGVRDCGRSSNPAPGGGHQGEDAGRGHRVSPAPRPGVLCAFRLSADYASTSGRRSIAHLELTDDCLILRLSLLDRLLALRGDLAVPLSHIRDVVANPPDAFARVPGILLTGTYLPGIVTAGTFRTPAGWVFFLVRDPRRAIRIDLANEFYRALIVQIDSESPEDVAWRIRHAIARRRGGAAE